jgi:hypothetical protein
MRFAHQITTVVLLAIVLSSAVLLYVEMPYEMGVRLVFRVSVTPWYGDAYLGNVTLNTSKNASPVACDSVSPHVDRRMSWGMKDPNSTLHMGINITLSRNGMPFDECRESIPFSREGEYVLIVLAKMPNLQTETYVLTIFYSSRFNATRTTHENSWNATIVMY